MTKSAHLCEIGIIGLGVMGNNLLLNMIDKGFKVAGFDKDQNKVDELQKMKANTNIHYTKDIQTFIALLKRPRAVLLLVPAGAIVDAVIQDLLPFLEKGDLIIDAGNSYFKDTDHRIHYLKSKGLDFLGVGISGGEEGARFGPSIMPGGSKAAYDRIHIIFEAIAAQINQDPCVTYLGPTSSGHFVKMVHNGIEYAIMQLVAETYDLMKKGLSLEDNQLQDIYNEWNHTELNSYLIEITSEIFEKKDDKTGKRLINLILDVAAQKGTGMWTAQTAMELQVPTPSIDMAVSERDLSLFLKERLALSQIYPHPTSKAPTHHFQDAEIVQSLAHALFASMLIIFSQGMALLRAGSIQYQYHLDLEAVARIWRGGCIIRAALLEDICAAFREKKDLSHLMQNTYFAQKINAYQKDLRSIISWGIDLGIPIPGFMSTLSYLDSYRSQSLPTNLIQAQRDYFGSHGYERKDMKGTFHTKWEEN